MCFDRIDSISHWEMRIPHTAPRLGGSWDVALPGTLLAVLGTARWLLAAGWAGRVVGEGGGVGWVDWLRRVGRHGGGGQGGEERRELER